jgi:Tfp pilus assembly protein PilO
MTVISKEKKTSRLLTGYYGSAFFLLTLAFISAAVFVLKPKLDNVKTVNAQIQKSLLQLSNERTYLDSLEQSIAAAGVIPMTVLSRAEQALPNEPLIPELLVLFSSIAERDQVKISNITFAEVRPKATAAKGRISSTSTVSEIQINLSVAADNYPQIKRFLRSVERSLRIVDIQGINVTSGTGDETLYSIQAKTYVYRPQISVNTAVKK